MSVTITINGTISLDQTAGLQADDVEVTNSGGVLGGALDANFLAFINSLTLTSDQKAFADLVEGASQPDLVSISATAGETIKSVFFSDASGNDFHGALVAGVTLLDGSPLYLWSENGGAEVIVTTSNVSDTAGTIAAAFFIQSDNAANTEAEVQSITFMPLLHPDTTNPNDAVNFTDIIKVSASVLVSTSVGGDIIVLDDGPTITVTSDNATATVDETFLGTPGTGDFSTQFTKDFGTDGPGGAAQYSLSTLGGDSGLVETSNGEHVSLFQNGSIVEGRDTDGQVVFTVAVDANGIVTLTQLRAVVQPNPNDPNDSVTLASDNLIQLHATITDGDGDPATAALNIGQNLFFLDDGPSISTTGTPPTVTVDETTLGTSSHANFAPNFSGVFGADGPGSITFDLGTAGGVIAGLTDSETGESVSISKVGNEIQGRDTDGALIFTVDVDASGNVTFDQVRSVVHPDATNPNDALTLGAANLVTLTATIHDGDGDTASAVLNIGQNLVILDDGPTVTVPSSAPDAAHAAHLGNAAGDQVTGAFGYDIGADDHNAAYYLAGGSDFVDANPSEAGIQLSLSGTVNGPPVSAITNTDVTLVSEDATQATFNWSFHYDKDPITAGVQDGTASGTLSFDKVADTFTITDNTPVQGFSFDVIHTSELVSKEPTSNVGHPLIVDETLVSPDATGHNGFVVQFTGNNSPFSFSANGEGSTSDTTFTGSAHDMVTSANETWVSATQSTNGVAGDTIQKGEALTLRFFDHSPGIVTEDTTPSALASGVEVKFDGIGNSENLIMVLDLHDTVTNQNITRSLVIDNADIYKASTPGGVPAPYNSEFSLDNNDGLVIIENNDYNQAGEHFQIQGMQIMQSSNGLTGSGINLNKAVGATGGSNVTGAQQTWGATDNDVLKITDIGFIQSTTGTQTANLDFAFNVHDADMDLLGVQHISALLSNAFV